MTNAMEKWINHTFSTGCEAGPDYVAFQKAARADLRRQAKTAGYTLHKFNPNHYEFSAVLRDEATGEFVYISISDVRFNRNWFYQVLYRKMAHDKDWTGGQNQYCAWADITESLRRMRRRCV